MTFTTAEQMRSSIIDVDANSSVDKIYDIAKSIIEKRISYTWNSTEIKRKMSLNNSYSGISPINCECSSNFYDIHRPQVIKKIRYELLSAGWRTSLGSCSLIIYSPKDKIRNSIFNRFIIWVGWFFD